MPADPAPATTLSESRSRVVGLLREADAPLGVQEIARRTGLHPNAARFHLDAPVEVALADRGADISGQPGRHARSTALAPPPATVGRRSYRLPARS